MNITITIPKNIFDDWLEEHNQAIDDGMELWFKIPSFPRQCKAGDKCYFIYNGRVMGYHYIERFEEVDDEGFDCQVTGKHWGKGIYIIRSPTTVEFFGIDKQINLDSHRGFRYVKSQTQALLKKAESLNKDLTENQK